jgi:uncharacterized surface protein with fasciclin (FAS1) repeats
LLKPEGLATLKAVLTYHVVAGNMTGKALMDKVKAEGGKAELQTVGGGNLTAMVSAGKLTFTDAKGGVSTVTIADVHQSNGVIHVVDTVLMPQ